MKGLCCQITNMYFFNFDCSQISTCPKNLQPCPN